MAVYHFDQAGTLSAAELRLTLGIATSRELDGCLQDHGLTSDKDRPQQDTRDQSDLVAKFQAFAAARTLGGLDVRALIAEGRR